MGFENTSPQQCHVIRYRLFLNLWVFFPNIFFHFD